MDLRPPGQGDWSAKTRADRASGGDQPVQLPSELGSTQVAPAPAVGCPIVLKPASQTPTPVLRLAEIIQQTAWPAGALSVLPAGRQAADRLVSDDRPQLLSFTGSAAVGWDMKARAGRKRVVLELGGNAAVLLDETIHSDDLDEIVKKLIYGAFSYAGQKCISVQRIYVVARDGGRLADEFTRRFLAGVQAIRCGDPRDPEVQSARCSMQRMRCALSAGLAKRRRRAQVLAQGDPAGQPGTADCAHAGPRGCPGLQRRGLWPALPNRARP